MGRGFEDEGYCVVRGPDRLWGGDIKSFHPPADAFEGVIGGPPCQEFSRLRRLNPGIPPKWGNLIPEFERVVSEARPRWFVMENIKEAPLPAVEGYHIHPTLLNNRWLGAEQNRVHRFSFGDRDGSKLNYDVVIFENFNYRYRVMACGEDPRHGKHKGNRNLHYKAGPTNATVKDSLQLQGLPIDLLDDAPLTVKGKQSVVGDAVSFPMARALARAVKRATN